MNNKPDYFRSLQILALEAVEFQDAEAFYRKICRWYSKTFFTPLDSVEDLPMDKVLLTYYEEKFDELYNSTDEDSKYTYNEYRKQILNPDEDVQTANDDEAWALKEIEALKKKNAKSGKEKISDVVNQVSQNIAEVAKEEFLRLKSSSPQEPNINDENQVDLNNFSMKVDDTFLE